MRRGRNEWIGAFRQDASAGLLLRSSWQVAVLYGEDSCGELYSLLNPACLGHSGYSFVWTVYGDRRKQRKLDHKELDDMANIGHDAEFRPQPTDFPPVSTHCTGTCNCDSQTWDTPPEGFPQKRTDPTQLNTNSIIASTQETPQQFNGMKVTNSLRW